MRDAAAPGAAAPDTFDYNDNKGIIRKPARFMAHSGKHIMPHMTHKEDRLDAWFDGSAVCLIAIGAHHEPLDLAQDEVEALILKLQGCLEEMRKSAAQS